MSVGVFVNTAGNEFLAAASFTGDQNRFRVACHALDQQHEALHGGAGHNELCPVDLPLNRRACFQCIPQRWPEYTSSASTLPPRLIPSRAKEKSSTATRETISRDRL